MVKIGKTSIFCLDDHKNFSDDVKKRFSDPLRYKVISTNSKADLLEMLRSEADTNSCKVVIISLHDTKENMEAIEHLTFEIKKVCQDCGIILLVHCDKLEEVKKTIRVNIDSYIPRNDNSILRIHNTVKKLISHRSLAINGRRRRLSLYVLLIFVIISLILLIVSYFRVPEFF
jgi:DNA-binding NarL/FixJ family response regulator